MTRQIDIDGKFYLFTSDDGPKNELLITAHGAYWPRPEFGRQIGVARNIPGLGGWFAVPASMNIHFYGPHKAGLMAPAIASSSTENLAVFETIGTGHAIRNYALAKFENDDYPSIIRRIDSGFGKDILTIRNRWRSDMIAPTFNEALSGLIKYGHRYSDIYCSFCRSRTIFDTISPYRAVRSPTNIVSAN